MLTQTVLQKAILLKFEKFRLLVKGRQYISGKYITKIYIICTLYFMLPVLCSLRLSRLKYHVFHVILVSAQANT